MTDIEKLILEKLGTLSNNVNDLNQEVKGLNQQVKKVDERVTKIDEKVTQTQITLENDISLKIDIIGEGHDFLKQRLDDALQMEKKREKMELELVNLRMDVKKIKEHLNIA